MLLPACFGPGHAPEALVAMDSDRALLGAAALIWVAAGDPPAFPVAVHVRPEWRGQGIGRSLVEAAAGFAAAEVPALQPWGLLDEASEEAAFCLATGFIVHHRMLHFEGEAEAMEAMLARYRERFDESGYVPAGARIVSLPEAPAEAVANLVAREFHNSPALMQARFQGRLGRAPDPDRSVVLLLDGVVMGAQLVTLGDDAVPEVEANVVHPSLRRGWANLLLTHEGTRAGVLHGSRRFRFYCDDRVIDTVNLARRSGASRTRVQLALRRPTGAAAVG